MAIKLDMSKAYDRVEWGFILDMLTSLGFSTAWTKRIMKCVMFLSFSFMINSEISGHVKPSRGLRQGDPLSLYLFLICVEGLSCLIFKAESSKALAGFCCNRGAQKLLICSLLTTACYSLKLQRRIVWSLRKF